MGKFYAAMYSLAYFSDDAIEVMKEASEVFPKTLILIKHIIMLYAFEEYPNNYKAAAQKVLIQDAIYIVLIMFKQILM